MNDSHCKHDSTKLVPVVTTNELTIDKAGISVISLIKMHDNDKLLKLFIITTYSSCQSQL